MGVRGFDHLAITTNDVGRFCDFYADLVGAEVLYRDRFDEGKFPIATLVIGANRINVHPSPPRAGLVADHPTPGAIDLCFRWDGPLDDIIAKLNERGLPIVEGPSFRLAADGSKGQSVYTRDPDDNLIEFLSTD